MLYLRTVGELPQAERTNLMRRSSASCLDQLAQLWEAGFWDGNEDALEGTLRQIHSAIDCGPDGDNMWVLEIMTDGGYDQDAQFRVFEFIGI